MDCRLPVTKKSASNPTVPAAGRTLEADVGGRIKHLRTRAKLSLRELAHLVPCSASFLSRVETNKTSPTLRQLGRIGAALGATVAELVRPQLPSVQALMVRHAFKRRSMLGQWNGVTLQHLLPDDMGQSFAALLLTIERDGKSARWFAKREIPELAIVLHGRVRFKLGGAVHDLAQGDSVCYDISVPHQWLNTAPRRSEIVLINNHFTPLEEWPGLLATAG
jgi:transcriptional regulator with XRE-family HTH domain